MDESSGPQGRSLMDTLSLSTNAGLPVELQSASASTSNVNKNMFGFPASSSLPPQGSASTSGPTSPLMSHEEGTSTRRSGRAIKRKKFDDEILVSISK